ncbi:LEAF RUST 10 DISEASE-RESISTANCE LOCUS RECEPTOR-LIKE PROTEIN KINASE-like 1.2 isoform X2 [Actinidia eriantha]|uniref:LEAF RUST 10 DISEASE-RESISTANCE LOCUS RECEPTOR-LIKE PROTEIN KINASE-like 1.2 isoform X2 n=1 Tax=Actinidia eriantha TaxID=165200 RepID=UPI002591154D|nr:LEAF RUST 10 DISEASE-RESISTANCE LOCUS RECEPTOR-LIKE PROTEIN KINASE-like 1.2 isoform X2 [Actinidia eriantha]
MGRHFALKFKTFFITILIIKVLVESDPISDWRYEACRPQNCGSGPNIAYPFQIIQDTVDFCGYPGFEVYCEGNRPIYATSRGNYFIENIFYQNNSFLLVNAMVINSTCPTPPKFFAFDRSSLSFGPNHADLYLFYNCTDSFTANYTGYPISCASNSTHLTFAYLDTGISTVNCTGLPCESWVAAPVEIEGGQNGQEIESVDYAELLRFGFTLEWVGIGCDECEKSGGRCGFNNSNRACFCLDGPHGRHCNDGKSNLKVVLGTAIPGSVILLFCLLVIAIWCCKKWNNVSSYVFSRNTSSDPSSKADLEGGNIYFGVPVFSYHELEEATNNFDPSKELGDGGFGTVYHGKLKDGREVAVKRLYEHNYKRMAQFINEIEILTRLRHKYLVSLYGCTSRQSRELLLVYEFIPNGTVADHLHGDLAEDGPLTWPIRMNIAIETADALAYLHASDIIHRDVKTTNILLDNNCNVKVADFGLSRLFPTDMTHVSTAPQGTPGYVDPEYHQCYQLTDKSDVYSFGVVLIELISSMPAVDISRDRHEINLANLAMSKIQNRAFHELIDPALGFESDSSVERMATSVAEVAFRCLQLEKEMRPTMDEVLEALKEIQEYKDDDFVGELASTQRRTSPEGNEAVLLKTFKAQPSPDTVTERWASCSTASISSR